MRRKIHINRGTTLFECMHYPHSLEVHVLFLSPPHRFRRRVLNYVTNIITLKYICLLNINILSIIFMEYSIYPIGAPYSFLNDKHNGSLSHIYFLQILIIEINLLDAIV